ncbi:MAG TPA: tRNA epoxyqueuosine(34) reductase QueG [Ignavibacteria bacterium]|nr:tRNA epoxyqueuosine(34) reductase QueG [Ignavibacteria bacterium]
MNENITNIIKQKCIEAGFIKVGISKAEELKEEGSYLKQWLDGNMNADMKWMNNTFEKRVSPGLVLSEVKSVISLAFLYDTPFAHKEDLNIPKISRYAWGERDYHKIIKKKLRILCPEIERLQENLKTRAYIDDGPVMDKAWAVRSGIGWMGKHTNVINKEFGSFFFIATVLTNAELEYDEPVEDLCRGCSICVSSCPTGAIHEEYSVDANLCISYQTIENRNEIPGEIDLSGWIFGCDICQDVCPFNDNKFFTDNELFFPRKEIFGKSAEEFLSLDEESFNKLFEGTPVRRTKYKGFIRNIKKLKK